MGVALNDVNAIGGKRCSASAYLKMAGAYPTTGSNGAQNANGSLTVWLRAQARKILVDSNKRAFGIDVVLKESEDDDYEEGEVNCVQVRARREIILAAGAVCSPWLLMLSGIGRKAHLEEKGIRCIHHLPGVGQHLQDHMHVPMSYRVGDHVSMANHSHSNICEGTLFCSTIGNRKVPNLQVHRGTIFFHPEGFTPVGEGFTLTPSLIHPKSVGHLELASDNPNDRPIICGNYLSDPRDVETLVDGIKHVRTIGNEMIERLGAGSTPRKIY